jgi:hypothetical protein
MLTATSHQSSMHIPGTVQGAANLHLALFLFHSNIPCSCLHPPCALRLPDSPAAPCASQNGSSQGTAAQARSAPAVGSQTGSCFP